MLKNNKFLYLIILCISISTFLMNCSFKNKNSNASSTIKEDCEQPQSSTAISFSSADSSQLVNEENLANEPHVSVAQSSSDVSSATSGAEDTSFEAYLIFEQYLIDNLSTDDYADIRMGTTGKKPCIWVVNSQAVEAMVAAYSGTVPPFDRIATHYSMSEIKQAIAEIEALPLVNNSYRKISSITCYEGFVDVLLLEEFKELEEYLISKYGEMVRINIIGVNPTS